MIKRGRSVALGAVLCMLFVSMAASEARAQAIGWSAPAGCPERARVQARVSSLLAQSPADASGLRAEGRIVRAGPRFQLELKVQVGEQHAARKLEADDCAALSDTAAWLIALAVDPNVTLPEQPDPKRPEAPAAAEPKPAAPTETKPKPAPAPFKEQEPVAAGSPAPRARERGTYLRVAAMGGVFGAKLPAAQGRLGLRAGFGLDWLYLELELAHMFARSRLLAQGGSARFSTEELGLRACALWGKRLQAGPCAELSGLRSQGETKGVTDPGQAAIYWATTGLSAQLNWLVWGPLELSLTGGLRVPISARPRFSVAGLREVGEASFVSTYGAVGLGARTR